MEKLLLMAAAVRGLGPEADISRVTTPKVVLTAVKWAGLDSDEVSRQWNSIEWHDSLDEVYEPLIRLVHPPEGGEESLFEGGGNWGVPGDPDRPAADPHFNSCRLTPRGMRLALALLALHPEYQKMST
jgi:hypothetical protein